MGGDETSDEFYAEQAASHKAKCNPNATVAAIDHENELYGGLLIISVE
jgi:hypothetical protein